jgi:hypothetical protein
MGDKSQRIWKTKEETRDQEERQTACFFGHINRVSQVMQHTPEKDLRGVCIKKSTQVVVKLLR